MQKRDTRMQLVFSFLLTVFALGCVSPPEKQEITSNVEDWREEIIYQVLIDRFDNGDPNNDYNVDTNAAAGYHGGDYQGLIDRLDYIEELGVTALWISPVVKNVEEDAGVAGYHGYWTQNFLEVNPHFGDLSKLRELVDECHDKGIKVILDIVANHIGQLFYYDINRNGMPNELVIGSGDGSPITRSTEWDPDYDSRGVQAFTSLGYSGLAPINWVWMPEINRVPPWPPEFANPDWYNRKGRVTVWGREKDACLNDGIISREQYDALGYWAENEDCKKYVRDQEMLGDFPGGLKDIKTELPEVREALINVFAYWIEQADFDGFRIDTLKHVEHEFWQTFCPEIRKRAKDLGKRNFYMFGEAFDGDDELIGSFTKNEELDGVFYFSQKFNVIDAVFKHSQPTSNIEALWAQRIPDQENMQQSRNYGIEAHENGPVDREGNAIPPYQMVVNFLDNHDLPRFLYVDDGEANDPCPPPDGRCSAELCSNGNWDTSNICVMESRRYRCDCPISQMKNALALLLTMDGIPCIYYGTEQNFNGGNDPANREDMWQSDFNTEGATFQYFKKLIAIRKQSDALTKGTMRILWSSDHVAAEQDAGIFAFERSYKGYKALVVFNTHPGKESETSASEEGGNDMQTTIAAGTRMVDRISGREVSIGDGGRLRLRLKPQSVAILEQL